MNRAAVGLAIAFRGHYEVILWSWSKLVTLENYSKNTEAKYTGNIKLTFSHEKYREITFRGRFMVKVKVGDLEKIQ